MSTTYDFKKVSVIIDGHIVTGFMDGSVVKWDKNADNVIPHIGADGEVTYSESNDKTGIITLTLKQNSASLSKVLELSEAKREFATRVVDTNTNGLRVGGTQSRIVKTPSGERGAEIAGVEVQIYVADFEAKSA